MNNDISSTQNYTIIYNIFSALLQLLGGFCLGMLGVFGIAVEADAGGSVITGVFLLFFAIIPIFFTVFYGVASWKIKNPGDKTAYYMNLIGICIGFTSILTMIPAIFLLIQWMKPEVKEYYFQEIAG